MLICIPLAFYYQIASRVVEMTDFSQVGFVQSINESVHMGDVIGATMISDSSQRSFSCW